jgi:serine/threonine-protein kinase
MEPYLVREVQAPDLSRLDQADPEVLERAVDEDVAAQLTEMMELVVERRQRRASADRRRARRRARPARAARRGAPPHAWFIGFAPADDPQVAVAVVVEDGGSFGSEATGGALSAPGRTTRHERGAPAMSPPAGVVDGLLAGRYRLVRLLGSGANGEVWRARDERLDRDVAVKVLRPELADDEEVRARFRAEARHAGGLRSPGIAAVFDFAERDDGAWLVMELVDGQSLSQVLRSEGRLPVDRTLDLVEQAAAALQVAHDGGVVHRDVKPGNLLLRPDGRLSVTDFGIAHAAGAAALTRTGQVVGTASYLSPEQASGQPVTPATDLYALGVVAHECLTGRRPFERDDPVAVLLAHLQTPPPPLPDDVPRPVADLVERLLAKDPADRPPSARQVQLEAAGLRRDLTTAVLPPTAVLPAPAAAATAATAGSAAPRAAVLGLAGRPGQRRAVRVTAVALGLLALAVGVRDALDDDPSPSDARQPRPTSSVPAPTEPTQTEPAQTEPAQTEPTRTEPTQTGPAPGETAERAPAEPEPAQEAPVDQEQQPVEPQGEQPAEPQDEVVEEQEERQEELEKQQEDREKELEKQREERGKGEGKGGDG